MGHSFANLSTANMTKYWLCCSSPPQCLPIPSQHQQLQLRLHLMLKLILIYSIVVTMVSTMDTMDTHMFIMERDLLMLSQKLNPRLTLILTYSMGHIIIIHTMDMHTILMDTTGENKSKCPQHS